MNTGIEAPRAAGTAYPTPSHVPSRNTSFKGTWNYLINERLPEDGGVAMSVTTGKLWSQLQSKEDRNKSITDRKTQAIIAGGIASLASFFSLVGSQAIGNTPFGVSQSTVLLLGSSLLAAYSGLCIGRQAGEAVDRLLCYRSQALKQPIPQTYLQKHRWEILGAAASIATTVTLTSLCNHNLGFFAYAFTGLNTVASGVMGYYCAHLQGRAQRFLG